MIEINSSPIRTSKNYGMNNFSLDENIFIRKEKSYNGFSCVLPRSAKEESFNGKNQNLISDEISKINLNFGENITFKKSETEVVFLNFDFDKDNNELIENINITVCENIKLKLVINFCSKVKTFHSGQINFECLAGSDLSVIILNDMSSSSMSFLSFKANLYEFSSFNFNLIDFSGNISVSRVETNLLEKNAKSNINSLYFGMKSSKIDLNLIQNVFGKECEVNTEVVGVLSERSEKNFKGTIDFKKGAKKSKGNENELCLMLKEGTKSKALPIILCTEEEVEGSHSTAVGKINDSELFYMMSRGLTKLEAQKILINSKLSVVTENIFDEKLKQKILKKIDKEIKYEG